MGDWLFLPLSPLCYRHFRVLGSIGCAQTVFARGTFKASFLSTYLLFDVANFQAFLFRTSLTSIKSLRRRRGTLMYFHYFSFQISRFVLSTEIVGRQTIVGTPPPAVFGVSLFFVTSLHLQVERYQSSQTRNQSVYVSSSTPITIKGKGRGLVI